MGPQLSHVGAVQARGSVAILTVVLINRTKDEGRNANLSLHVSTLRQGMISA